MNLRTDIIVNLINSKFFYCVDVTVRMYRGDKYRASSPATVSEDVGVVYIAVGFAPA